MAINEEASPICRGKNLSWETVMLFFNYIPKEPMPKDKFNSRIEDNINSWTQTHSQIARQLAFYYEDDGVCYPRFNHASTLSDLFNYMVHWAHNYFVPNPYAPSLKGKVPTSIYSHIVKCIESGIFDFDTALDTLFDVPLSSHDKVKVYLQNYTNIKFDQGVIKINDCLIDNSQINTPTEEAATNPKQYFLYYSTESTTTARKTFEKRTANKYAQQIFYGAPGTGKSHKVKEVTDKLPKSDVFRTTFHPDSDYSTFVGCYKPKMVKAPIRDGSGHEITSACEDEKKRIAYEFVPQAFINAYVRAYHTEEPVFLVIEEINRGNCAQIFGDMFQLLDRNCESGESDYAIKPDSDLQNYLSSVMADARTDKEEIKTGEEMCLPSNLHIWATMNTSDQSLFPIDSAFKRRWDWKYMPICKGRDENGNELNWKIAADTKEYDWWSFLTKINDHINSTTNSEDKKLGFFFCKPQDGRISSETFVGKVIFYLWNDVFKDFGFEGPIFKDSDGSELSFNKFYKTDNKGKVVVQKDKVELFLNNLGVDVVKDNLDSTKEREEDEDGNDISSPSTGRDYTKFSINGVGRYGKNNLAAECVKKYIELNPEKTIDEVLREWMSLGNIVPHFIETKEQFDARTDNSKRSHEISCGDTVLYVAHNGYGNNGKVQVLIDAVNNKSWGITLSKA